MDETAAERTARLAKIGEIVSEGLQNGGVLAMQSGAIQITLDTEDPEKALKWLEVLESAAFPPTTSSAQPSLSTQPPASSP